MQFIWDTMNDFVYYVYKYMTCNVRFTPFLHKFYKYIIL